MWLMMVGGIHLSDGSQLCKKKKEKKVKSIKKPVISMAI